MQWHPISGRWALQSRRFDTLDAFCALMAIVVGGPQLYLIATLVHVGPPPTALEIAILFMATVVGALLWPALSLLRRLPLGENVFWGSAILVLAVGMPSATYIFELYVFGKATFWPSEQSMQFHLTFIAAMVVLGVFVWWLQRD